MRSDIADIAAKVLEEFTKRNAEDIFISCVEMSAHQIINSVLDILIELGALEGPK